MCFDYLFFGKQPVLIMKESMKNGVYAWGVGKKGSTGTGVVKRVEKVINELGYNRVIIRTDQRPAIKELANDVKREKPFAWRVERRNDVTSVSKWSKGNQD